MAKKKGAIKKAVETVETWIGMGPKKSKKRPAKKKAAAKKKPAKKKKARSKR